MVIDRDLRAGCSWWRGYGSLKAGREILQHPRPHGLDLGGVEEVLGVGLVNVETSERQDRDDRPTRGVVEGDAQLDPAAPRARVDRVRLRDVVPRPDPRE